MARGEMHLLALDQPSSPVVVQGPSFVPDSAEHRGTHRRAHRSPLEWWTSVQEHACGKPKGFLRRSTIDQEGVPTGQVRESLAISTIDQLTPFIESGEQLTEA
jgi:hypothetical protein